MHSTGGEDRVLGHNLKGMSVMSRNPSNYPNNHDKIQDAIHDKGLEGTPGSGIGGTKGVNGSLTSDPWQNNLHLEQCGTDMLPWSMRAIFSPHLCTFSIVSRGRLQKPLIF